MGNRSLLIRLCACMVPRFLIWYVTICGLRFFFLFSVPIFWCLIKDYFHAVWKFRVFPVMLSMDIIVRHGRSQDYGALMVSILPDISRDFWDQAW